MSYISSMAGITLDSAFKLDSAQPLDVRFVVPSGKSKNDLLTSSVYAGLEVWDLNDNKKYRAIPSGSSFKWEEVVNGGNFSAGNGIAISSNQIHNTGITNISKSGNNGYITKTTSSATGTSNSDVLVYELPTASSSTLGGVKIGYSENGQNYAVKLSSNQMYVYVPWTDTKVANTVNTSTKYYLTGTTSSSTNTGGQIFDTNVYVNTTAGALHASSFNIDTNATIKYDSTNKCIKFVFA